MNNTCVLGMVFPASDSHGTELVSVSHSLAQHPTLLHLSKRYNIPYIMRTASVRSDGPGFTRLAEHVV